MWDGGSLRSPTQVEQRNEEVIAACPDLWDAPCWDESSGEELHPPQEQEQEPPPPPPPPPPLAMATAAAVAAEPALAALAPEPAPPPPPPAAAAGVAGETADPPPPPPTAAAPRTNLYAQTCEVATRDPASGGTAEWCSFDNVWLPYYYLMGFSDPHEHEGGRDEILESCLKLGCAAVTIEDNGWIEFFRNVPRDQAAWEAKPASTMYVVGDYLRAEDDPKHRAQPDPRIGCSRHSHACVGTPAKGSAPCCATVVREIMLDMTAVLGRHGLHWRVSQGQQLSLARDGIVQPFGACGGARGRWNGCGGRRGSERERANEGGVDRTTALTQSVATPTARPAADHDFDPMFEVGQHARSLAIIEREMHLSGGAAKWREADYYYTKIVAARQETDWDRCVVARSLAPTDGRTDGRRRKQRSAPTHARASLLPLCDGVGARSSYVAGTPCTAETSTGRSRLSTTTSRFNGARPSSIATRRMSGTWTGRRGRTRCRVRWA